MSNRAVNLLYLLFFVATILIMSWRDMNPSAPPAPQKAFPYYASVAATLDMVPQDLVPVIAAQGSFSYDSGKMHFAPQGLKPATFAQRQVSLQFRFEGLPHGKDQTEATLAQIKATLDAWEHLGNNIAAIFMEYTAEKPDLKAYRALIDAAYGRFHLHYTFGKSITLGWLQALPAKEIEPLLKDQLYTLLVQPKDWNSPETLKTLRALPYNILMELPMGILPDDVPQHVTDDLPMVGFYVTLDPRRPLPKYGHKVGLFPHF